MVYISKKIFVLTQKMKKKLTSQGIKIPEDAVFFNHVFAPKFNSYTEIYTFKDSLQKRLTQIKKDVNKIDHTQTIQERKYEYIQAWQEKGKIESIHQKKYTPDGKVHQTTWQFYHSKDDSPVRFSQQNKNKHRDNFLKADGIVIDKNGLKIRPISTAEYVYKKEHLNKNNFVNSPWTLKQSITTKDKCGTDSVQECSVVGIYGENGISLNHLNPNNPENEKFNYIEFELMEQLEQQGKNAKAFIIGACESDDKSNRQYEGLIDLFASENVPFSQFKTGDDILYKKFKNFTKITQENAKKLRNGLAAKFEWQSGHHIIYENGELQIANPIIDSELKQGNTDPYSLLKKSFSIIK